MTRPNDITTDESLVLTGRKRSGKSYLAGLLSHETLGFSDGMKEVCRLVLGTTDKSCDDVRGFLRNLGAMGRGARAGRLPRELRNRVDWGPLRWRLRRNGAEITGMGTASTWESFGETENFWVDLLEDRVEVRGPDTPVVLENARFPEEVRRFTDGHDFEHLHVVCSEATRRARLNEAGEELSPHAKTEQLGRELDRVAKGETPLALDLAQELNPTTVDGVRTWDSVVWSDERASRVSPPETCVMRFGEEWECVDPVQGGFDATRDEPEPDGDGVDVAQLVHEDLEDRVEEGREQYGERLQAGNGRNALVDAYEEALDLALYLRQQLAETR